MNVIFDKQYYLKLSQTKVQTAGDGVTVNIEAKTNYDANPDTGYLPGASLNKSAMDTWPTVNMMSQITGIDIKACFPLSSGSGVKSGHHNLYIIGIHTSRKGCLGHVNRWPCIHSTFV